MNQYSNFSFNFHNYSLPKYPQNVKARYCFEPELIKIPKTDALLQIDPKTWVIFDEENENLWAMTSDQFLDIYIDLLIFQLYFLQLRHQILLQTSPQ